MSDETRQILSDAFIENRVKYLRFLKARVRNDATAEDLLQDLFIKITQAKLPETIEKPESFIYRMASNLMLDHIRASKRRQNRNQDWTDQATTQVGNAMASNIVPIDDVIIAREKLDAVRKSLETLSPKSREAFRRAKFQGQSYSEIAEAMYISVSTVEKHMIKALRHVTQAFEDNK